MAVPLAVLTPTGNVTHIERYNNVTYCGVNHTTTGTPLRYVAPEDAPQPCARCTHNYKLACDTNDVRLRRYGFDV